jgi:hypothetical protein
MKFLCVTCDEGLRHQETRGPDEGVMTVIFACPGCGWEMAMYTNPWETQMVRSLDVKIGGRSVPAKPMEMLRSSLGRTDQPLAAPASSAVPEADEAPKCPFAEVVADAYTHEGPAASGQQPASGDVRWTPEAEQRVEQRIPSFVRSMARMGIEKYAREHGYQVITPDVLDEAKDVFMG